MKKALREMQTLRAAYADGVRPPSGPNLNRIALFVQKLLGGQNYQIWSRDPGHAHLGVILYSLRSSGPTSIGLANLKRIVQFVQKLLRGSGSRK